MEAQKRGPLFSWFEASVWEFPLAFQKWVLGLGNSSEVEEALLKGCQAWTNLANQTMDRVFQADGFAQLMTASVQQFVRYQHVARDFMESLAARGAHTNGVRPAGDVKDLHDTVGKLRRDVRALTARVNLIDRGDDEAIESREAELH